MNKKLDLILEKLSNIEGDISNIKKELEIIKKQTSKMDTHVDFVNNVYEKVEAPLNYVCDKFNLFLGSTDDNDQKLLE